MLIDGPGGGVERVECEECGGYDDLLTDGTIIQVHRGGCSKFEPCGCEEEDCEACEAAAHAAHFYDPALVAIGLRLLVAAVEDDADAVCMALDDIPECWMCERTVWLSVLRVAGHYGTDEFADVLRRELLAALDAAAKNQC